jgi:Chemotaxis response regulator containing a CheY-like receiver domain and a methylesterase domain
MIKVLIVEDSPTMRELLTHILESDTAIQVVKTVRDGAEAVAAVRRWRPNIITMDVHMPKMNGFEATRRIMATQPVPIIIVSGTLTDQVAATFRAIEAGALAFVRHPPGPGHPDHEAAAAELVQMIKLMAEIKVVRRWVGLREPGSAREMRKTQYVGIKIAPADVNLVAIGASTGGRSPYRIFCRRCLPDCVSPCLSYSILPRVLLKDSPNGWASPVPCPSMLPMMVNWHFRGTFISRLMERIWG